MIMAVDIGTTNVKLALFDTEGRKLFTSKGSAKKMFPMGSTK